MRPPPVKEMGGTPSPVKKVGGRCLPASPPHYTPGGRRTQSDTRSTIAPIAPHVVDGENPAHWERSRRRHRLSAAVGSETEQC